MKEPELTEEEKVEEAINRLVEFGTPEALERLRKSYEKLVDNLQKQDIGHWCEKLMINLFSG